MFQFGRPNCFLSAKNREAADKKEKTRQTGFVGPCLRVFFLRPGGRCGTRTSFFYRALAVDLCEMMPYTDAIAKTFSPFIFP